MNIWANFIIIILIIHIIFWDINIYRIIYVIIFIIKVIIYNKGIIII